MPFYLMLFSFAISFSTSYHAADGVRRQNPGRRQTIAAYLLESICPIRRQQSNTDAEGPCHPDRPHQRSQIKRAVLT